MQASDLAGRIQNTKNIFEKWQMAVLSQENHYSYAQYI